MWIRKRLDIRSSDILSGMSGCLLPGSSPRIQEKIAVFWEREGESAVVCYSVRTGLDLLLQAADFEKGSEIIISALTIPDMPRIIEYHGYIPVPVDIDIETLAPTAANMESAITSRTKAVIVAHLFGNIVDLREIAGIAKSHNLLLIEDCAQCYHGRSFTGSDAADISMFSFGTIKTATALGGGVLILRKNSKLTAAMHSLHAAYPAQKRSTYVKKLIKYMLLTPCFSPTVYRCFVALLNRTSIDYDTLIQGLSRSFSGGDLLSQIRLQPSFPLMRLLLRRFETFSVQTLEERIRKGRHLLKSLPQEYRYPGVQSEKQTFWVFPILCDDPDRLIRKLRNSGFDATQKHSLQLVAPPEGQPEDAAPNCSKILRHIVYLPLYHQMPAAEIDRMIDLMEAESSQDQKQ